jgi:cell division protease FtsH
LASGDGYTTVEGKLQITSASQRLIRELAWLCAMHGIKTGIGHGLQRGGRIIKSKPLPDGAYWRLTIGSTSNPLRGGIGTREHKKAVVQQVVRKPFDGYVYDLVGCDHEAFFGGEKPVLLHNSRVRDLFEQAKKSAPCLVFIDEIDAVGRQRGAGLGGGHDEREQTLNQLLVEMDGFDPNAGIIVIAATNRPDILDPALLRPGRFDRRIVVDNPDSKGRREILNVHVRGKPLGEGVNLDILAKHTPGFSGADLANLVNEAALLAARRNKKKITMPEMDEAIERVIAGPQRRSRILGPKEREIAAFHEGGHALLGKLLPNADPPHKVTILPRGMALGYVISAPPEDKYTYTKTELLDRITAMLGGRVAEELVFNEVTTGAQNDFEQATDLTRRMVTDFGMSEKLGPLSLGKRHGPIFLGRDLVETRNYSEEIAYEIDKEVRRITDECYIHAREILIANREKLDRVARALLERESLEGEEISKVMAGEPLPELQAAPAAEPKAEPARPEPQMPALKPKPEAS